MVVWAVIVGIVCAVLAFLMARRLERGERDSYVAKLSPFDRARLQVFENTGRSWRLFREKEKQDRKE